MAETQSTSTFQQLNAPLDMFEYLSKMPIVARAIPRGFIVLAMS